MGSTRIYCPRLCSLRVRTMYVARGVGQKRRSQKEFHLAMDSRYSKENNIWYQYKDKSTTITTEQNDQNVYIIETVSKQTK